MDTRYLLNRRGTWYLRIPHPPREWGMEGAFVRTLGTESLAQAQRLRDKYVYPLLAESTVPGMLSAVARGLAASLDATERGLAALKEHLPSARPELTLKNAVAAFLDFLGRAGDYAPGTLEDYAGALGGLVQILGEGLSLEALTPADVARFRDTLLALPVQWKHRTENTLEPAGEGQRTVSPATVRKHLIYARRMWRWCADEGRIPGGADPFERVAVARTRQPHKRPPDAAEIEKLMDLPCPDGFDALTWWALPRLLRYTACRVGEIAQLTAADLVTVQGVRCIRITAAGDKRLKTEASERLVPVADKLVPTVDRVLHERPEGRLFDCGDYLKDDVVLRYAKGYVKHFNRRAKKVGAGLTVHTLRVYGNTNMASAGVDLLDRERLLGHRSERVQAAYTAPDLARLKRAVDSIP